MTKKKPNKSEQKRELNSQKILDVAENLFALNGFDGTSMSAIAANANLPKANVLYYFKSKSNLYQQVLGRIVTSWNLGFEKVTVDDDPAIALASYIRSKLKMAFEQPHQSRLFATEVIRGAQELQDYIQAETKPWVASQVDLIQGWIDAEKITAVDPLHLLFHIWGITQYYADYQAEVMAIINKNDYQAIDKNHIFKSACALILQGVGLSLPDNINYEM